MSYRVHYVPKILSVRKAALRKMIREVLRQLWVVFHERIDVFDGKLVVDWHVDVADLVDFEQLFQPAEDLLEEVFIEHRVRRHIKLH